MVLREVSVDLKMSRRYNFLICSSIMIYILSPTNSQVFSFYNRYELWACLGHDSNLCLVHLIHIWCRLIRHQRGDSPSQRNLLRFLSLNYNHFVILLGLLRFKKKQSHFCMPLSLNRSPQAEEVKLQNLLSCGMK